VNNVGASLSTPYSSAWAGLAVNTRAANKAKTAQALQKVQLKILVVYRAGTPLGLQTQRVARRDKANSCSQQELRIAREETGRHGEGRFHVIGRYEMKKVMLSLHPPNP
jgi:hypothetical protein